MSDVKKPSCGRIVHYFPNGKDEISSANNAEKVPAIVVQSWGGMVANLSVFPMNPDATNVLRYSVPHFDDVPKNAEGLPLAGYWNWPTID